MIAAPARRDAAGRRRPRRRHDARRRSTRSLDELAAIARERGSAIATGSAFPATIDRVAAFAKAAADRGIALVPITALLPARKS